MKLVILESPYKAANGRSVAENIQYARQAVHHSLLNSEAPLASHILYTQPDVLCDYIDSERELGISAGHAWIKKAELMACYVDFGISPGMEIAMREAEIYGLPIEFRKIL